MKADDREIEQSPLYQGEDESIAYALTTTPWGGSPTNAAVVLKDADGADISGTNLTGAVVVAGDVITSPEVHSLTADARYRLEYAFTVDSNDVETWTTIYGQE